MAENTLEPPPNALKPIRDMKIIARRVLGSTVQECADDGECSKSTAEAVLRRHRDYVERMTMEGARTFLKDFHGMVQALARTASDPENRNQVGAFKEGCEKLLGLGLRNQTHYGDVNIGSVTINDESRAIVLAGDSPELREMRERYGVG